MAVSPEQTRSTQGCDTGRRPEFHVKADIRLINKTSGSGRDKALKEKMKEARDDFIKQLKLHVCALRNSGGGTLWIHINGVDPSDKCLEYFNELVDERLNGMIPDGSLFANTCAKVFDKTSNNGLIEFSISPSKYIVTYDYKTREPLDNSIIHATSVKINKILRNGLTFRRKSPTIRGVHNEMEESRDVQVKSLSSDKICNKSMEEIIQYVWDDLKLKYSISAFSKLARGGSFYLGIKESRQEFETYNSKKLIPTGFRFPVDLHNYFINHLKEKAKRETIVLQQRDGTHVFTREDLIAVVFHPLPGEDHMYVLEVAVAPVEGIVFYDKEGPEAYEVNARGEISRITKEKWYLEQWKLATEESQEKVAERTANTTNTSAGAQTRRVLPVPDNKDKGLEQEITKLRDENTTLKQRVEDLSRMLDTASLSELSMDSGQGSDLSSLASWSSRSSTTSSLRPDGERRSRGHGRGRGLLKGLKKSFKHDPHSLKAVSPVYIDKDSVHVYNLTDDSRKSSVFLHCRPIEIAKDPFMACYVEGELLNITPATAVEQSQRQDGVRLYQATFSTSPFPISQGQSPDIQYWDYWEARVVADVQHKEGTLSPLLELGVSEQVGRVKETLLHKHSQSWCICIGVCDVHKKGMCVQIWGHGVYTRCVSMIHGEINTTFGILLDVSKGKLVFTDAETGDILDTFEKKFTRTLYPVFGVLPSSDKRKLELKLNSGPDVEITEKKKQLISSCLQ